MNTFLDRRRGQTSIFTIVFYVIVFVIFIGGGLGYFITSMSGMSVQIGGLTGIEAFFIANLILWIIIFFIIAIFWWSK